MISVHPTWRGTSPRGVVPVGLGDGVGHCHDAANLPKELFFCPLVFFSEQKTLLFFLEFGFLFLFTAGYASS